MHTCWYAVHQSLPTFPEISTLMLEIAVLRYIPDPVQVLGNHVHTASCQYRQLTWCMTVIHACSWPLAIHCLLFLVDCSHFQCTLILHHCVCLLIFCADPMFNPFPILSSHQHPDTSLSLPQAPSPTLPNDDRHDDSKHDLLAIKVLMSSGVSSMKSDGKWMSALTIFHVLYIHRCLWNFGEQDICGDSCMLVVMSHSLPVLSS